MSDEKRCTDCRHALTDYPGICTPLADKNELVSSDYAREFGAVLSSSLSIRGKAEVMVMCGPEGLLFEPKGGSE